VLLGSDGDAVGDDSAEDLADTVEGEPDVDTAPLFLLCVPLRVLVEVWGVEGISIPEKSTKQNQA
jgi:hypothetical protein